MVVVAAVTGAGVTVRTCGCEGGAAAELRRIKPGFRATAAAAAAVKALIPMTCDATRHAKEMRLCATKKATATTNTLLNRFSQTRGKSENENTKINRRGDWLCEVLLDTSPKVATNHCDHRNHYSADQHPPFVLLSTHPLSAQVTQYHIQLVRWFGVL